ncbi:NADH-quinone oxidoreductase subunit N [Evansella vedderi]|uniref:NADH-quinone oxidoreductase subunit N n=1 Tax=Evansella vedderi TaxID=38282 RepID=A0ABU0A155_9BACI|nr:NADH-quinone oxidoreductase subunit N [Evansella vedderi]MDQ0257212.1 NADH-quinone oxidoreductase subunit N [Evansella vedderi]
MLLANDANWSLMTPEIVLAALALIIFTIDFMTDIKGKKPFLGRLSIISLLITAVLVLFTNNDGGTIGHVFVVDSFSMVFKLIILVGVALVIGISMYYLDKHEDIYQGEYYSLMLFATLGAMLMVSSADLIVLFVGLEILSISSYCLAAFKKYNRKSTEAGIKYVVLGGTASAFILYGMSFLYGLTGTTSIVEIREAIPTLWVDYTWVIAMSFLFMLAGFGFKISAVPFHMWAPDVYEGSPTPVTAFLSVVSKLAGFAIVLRLFFVTFENIYVEWAFTFAVIAALTMVIGNFIALTQKNVKRLMAYSGIAQAGYLLVPIAAVVTEADTFTMIAFYGMAYVLMTLGAFAIIILVTEDSGKEDMSSFKGLWERSPYMAVAMSVFLISLAGLPLTLGFWGKAYIFFGAVAAGMTWLAVVMIVTSVVSFFYYFGIIRQMFMREPEPTDQEIKVPVYLSVVVTICLAVTVALAFIPSIVMDWLQGLTWMGMF